MEVVQCQESNFAKGEARIGTKKGRETHAGLDPPVVGKSHPVLVAWKGAGLVGPPRWRENDVDCMEGFVRC